MEFGDELRDLTVRPEEGEKGLYDGKDKAEKIIKDLKKIPREEVEKKIKESSENKPDKVNVKNLTKQPSQGIDEIE